jgi:PAS domain S-box-containing protein
MADLFTTFASPLQEALLLVRADGSIAAANPKALELLGTHNIEGRSLREFFAEPDEMVRGFLRACARSKSLLPGALTLRGGAEQSAFRAEGAVVQPARQLQPAVVLLRLVPKQVSIARFHLLNAQIEAQAREIQRRKQSESALADQRRWLEVTLSSIGDAVIATDAAGCISFMNPVAESLTGWRQSDARGKVLATVFRIVHEGTRNPVEDPVVKVLRDGKIVGIANHTVLIANDGAERPIDDSAAPIRGADGGIDGVVLVFRDISARKRADQEREELLEAERAARMAAERASRMKDEFLATISHELRTPLNAILGWSQVLRLAPPTSIDMQQGLEVIERNARAQTQIIEDLLDMSRIISGKIRLDVQQVDLLAVIENALETVRPSAAAREIRLQPALDPRAGPVSGDPSRLQQVFWNLLSNAIKFTPKGGRVQILLERVNSHVEVSVTDTGVGINPEFLPRLFERFSQADSSTTRHHGGLGIGLAIVKQLVELHGGMVRAKSAGEGQGATFIVTLPLTVVHPALEQRRHPKGSLKEQSGDCSPRLDGVTVLVVDDEPDARELVSRVLSDCGAEVRTAGSAADARAMIMRAKPTVLVSDIGMPGEDGYALIRQIRKGDAGIGQDIPAIALTAYARSEDRQRAILSGFQMHIAKPVEPAELIAMVASLAGRVSQGD